MFVDHRAWGSLQERQHASDCWRTLPLQPASVEDEGRLQVRDGVAALWKLFLYYDVSACRGREK